MDAILEELLRHGVALVGLNVLLQQLGLPIPSVPTMMVAGALALDGRISGPGAFAVAVAASVVADLLWFAGGRRFGYRVLKLLCRMSLSPDSCVATTRDTYARWGAPSLVVAKFVPGFAALATVASRNWGIRIRSAPAIGGATVENPGTNLDTTSE
jgi:membrane protein DedA with SNARE-associated domain